MVISRRCICTLFTTYVIALSVVNGKCTVLVNGRPASPANHHNINDETQYIYETVSEVGKVLMVHFSMTVDTWRQEDPVQRFTLNSDNEYMETCNGRDHQTCPLSYNYTVPNLTEKYRPTKAHGRLDIVSEGRTVCILDITTASEYEKINFDPIWHNESGVYILEVAVKTGFPGPVDVVNISCGSIPVTNFPECHGCFIFYKEDLVRFRGENCKVAVSNQHSSMTKNVPIPILPEDTAQNLTDKGSNSSQSRWPTASIIVTTVLGVVIVLLCVIFFMHHKRNQQITIINQPEKKSTQDAELGVKHSPSLPSNDESTTSMSDCSDELETDGPVSDTQPSCSVVVHPVEESQHSEMKPQDLDERVT